MATPQHSNNPYNPAFIWVLAFSLANLYGTVIWAILKQGFQVTALPWVEVFVWIVLSAIVVQTLIKENLTAEYISAWKRNWILIPFIALTILSLLWTVSVPATLYRVAALLFSSLVGAYFGFRYSLTSLLEILFRFGTFLLILCFALAVFLPVVGAMLGEPYGGAWRGIFWHKNQFGGLAALFSMVFLIRALDAFRRKEGRPLLDIAFYLFTAVNVFFSKSAAGYILFLLMTFLVCIVFVWIGIRQRLKPVHYYAVLGLGSLVALLILLNLDVVFGLFNRDTSLTGRVPLWNYLIQEILSQRPWLGFGFGAIWSLASFRIETQQVVGWGFPVAIADNGFLDILLHVGGIGFTLFVVILLVAFARSCQYALQHISLPAFFSLLLLVFAFFANLSFSFFLETETFIWMLIVAVLFSMTKPP